MAHAVYFKIDRTAGEPPIRRVDAESLRNMLEDEQVIQERPTLSF